jgi:predicted Zn-dependent protease
MRWSAVAVAMLVLTLAGCASDRGGLATALPTPVARPVAVESVSEREHRELVASFGGEYRAPAMERLIADLMRGLGPVSGAPVAGERVTILDNPGINAFALPSGRLYVTRGLLALANDEAELAAVLAHELAHVALNHARTRAELERRSVLVSRVVAEVLNDPDAGAAMRDKSRLNLASFSRQQELEADALGVRTLAAAGFDPYGAARFLASLGRSSAPRAAVMGERTTPDFLATHPSTPERVATALAAARETRAPGTGRRDRNSYLAALDGLTYGDDPSRGTLRGRTFIDPRIPIAFSAPEGFVLDRSATALVGVEPGSGRAMRYDQVATGGLDAAKAIAEGWIEGVTLGEVETLTLAGKTAATATGQGRDWNFRFVAVPLGGVMHRFIFASRPGSGDPDRGFRQAIESIRMPDRAELAALKPLRLRLVTAQTGDAPESLAARMQGVDRALDRFLILNGLDRGDPVRPGEIYKIVVE